MAVSQSNFPRAALLFGALCLLPLAACSGGGGSADGDDDARASRPRVVAGENVAALGATVRLNANPEAPSAAYFTLIGGARDAVLTGASSPDLARAEMHETRTEGGVTTMAPLARLAVPAGAEVVFRQGGKHVMLFGISEAARARGTMTLMLSFEGNPPLEVTLALTPPDAAAAPGAAAHEGMHDGHAMEHGGR